MRALAHDLAAQAADRGTIEFAADISAPFNAGILGAMFGLPDAEFLRLRHWLDDFFLREPAAPGEESRQEIAMRELGSYLSALAAERIEHPADDLISAMIEAEEDGQKLDLEQVVVTTMTFLTAGFESTNNCFTNLAFALAQHPEVLRAVRRDPTRVGDFVEEGIRWDAPAQGFVRSPTTDVELHGKTIPAGAQVLLHLGSANRDERRFAYPDLFMLDQRRPPPPRLRPGAFTSASAPPWHAPWPTSPSKSCSPSAGAGKWTLPTRSGSPPQLPRLRPPPPHDPLNALRSRHLRLFRRLKQRPPGCRAKPLCLPFSREGGGVSEAAPAARLCALKHE